MTSAAEKPAILIAHTRSGGTFLAHCLGSHPDIFCPRGEPLITWQEHLPDADPVEIIAAALHAYHYKVSMCRVTDIQTSVAIYDYLREVDAKIIVLERENLLRCAVSQTLMNMVNRGEIERAIHTTKTAKVKPVEVQPIAVLERCRWQKEWQERTRRDVEETGLGYLYLTYEDIVGGEKVSAERVPLATTEKICSFLGVEQYPLVSHLRAVSPYDLEDIVSNWTCLQAVIEDSEFAEWIPTTEEEPDE